MKDFLFSLLQTLNRIEVRGKDNVDYLLGCILAVENAIAQIEKDEADKEVDDG